MANVHRSKSLPKSYPESRGVALRRAQNIQTPLPTMHEGVETVHVSNNETTSERPTGRRRGESLSASIRKYVDSAAAKIPGTPQRQARRHARGTSESYTRPPNFPNMAMESSPALLEGAPVETSLPIAAVPLLLQQGTLMHKVSAKRTKSQIFRLDPDMGILWVTKNAGRVPIEAIKEIREGNEARSYREQFKIAEDAASRWLTIIYFIENKYKSLHLVAQTRDLCHMWHIALQGLLAERQRLMNGLDNEDMRQALFERQLWLSADKHSDRKLDIDEVDELCRQLNIYVTRDDLKRRVQEADVQKQGYLKFPDFQRFVKQLKRRPEVDRLFLKASRNGKRLDLVDFVNFMREYQKSSLSERELERIFVKFADRNESSAVRAVASPQSEADEPLALVLSDVMQPAPTAHIPESEQPQPNKQYNLWSLSAFTSFLLSAENAAFADQHGKVWHDMNRPISEYFISSSHNTYLTGHQIVGTSSFEGYIRALLCGCRSVELDIFDGEPEPVVYHGRAFTGRVSLREACEAIQRYAFVASEYPIIISAEVHCSVTQQDAIARIMREVFDDMLVTARLEEMGTEDAITTLPSPHDLRRRVLLKTKNLFVSHTAGEDDETMSETSASPSDVTSPSESEAFKSDLNDLKAFGSAAARKLGLARGKSKHGSGDGAPSHSSSRSPETLALVSPPAPNPEAKIKMSPALAALLVYTVGVKCRGINKKVKYATEHVFSLSERVANKYVRQSESMLDLVKHNRTHVVRIYPSGTRVNSSNYEPHRFWAAGAQLAAINWQTFDLGYRINYSMFQRNGRSGYVLKPLALRTDNKKLIQLRTRHCLEIIVISAQQLPRPRDGAGREILDKQIIDPFVEVSVHVPDWTHSPFQERTERTEKEKERERVRRTNVVKNNGFNPVWEERFEIPFDVVGEMRDLVFVRFEVRDDSVSEPIASYIVSLGSLQMGYRHLPLHDSQMSQYLFSTLFVRIGLHDVSVRV